MMLFEIPDTQKSVTERICRKRGKEKMSQIFGAIMLGVMGVYIGTIVLLNIPSVQQVMSLFVAEELSDLLNTRVTIGRINIIRASRAASYSEFRR